MPEHNPVAAALQGATFGAIGSVPIVGGIVAGVIQSALESSARARQEDWWATVAARLSVIEEQLGEHLQTDHPEFVSAAFRLTRAAEETADDEKRDRLASALAHAGPWSALPSDRRERMERLLTELTSREILMLRIVADPGAWLKKQNPAAVFAYQGNTTGTFQEFLDSHVSHGDLDEQRNVQATLESLSRRELIGAFAHSMTETRTGEEILAGKAASLGLELLGYLNEIEP